jgi:hypothetical protein
MTSKAKMIRVGLVAGALATGGFRLRRSEGFEAAPFG